MKSKKYFFFACIPLALSLIVLAAGFVDREITCDFNQRIFKVLDKYGSEFPMPSAEIDELDRLLSRPRPNPISNVVIEYWGTSDATKEYCNKRVAYTYETPLSSSGTFSMRRNDRPWYLESSNQYNNKTVLGWFATVALILFVPSIGLFCLWLYNI